MIRREGHDPVRHLCARRDRVDRRKRLRKREFDRRDGLAFGKTRNAQKRAERIEIAVLRVREQVLLSRHIYSCSLLNDDGSET